MNHIKRILRLLYYRWKYKDKHLKLYVGANIHFGSSFEGFNKVCNGTTFKGRLGLCSYIGSNCDLSANIGRFSSIAYGTKSIVGTHSYTYPYVSTSPIFVSLKKQVGITFADKQYIEEFRYASKIDKVEVTIGNDCWIGYEARIIAGVKIGDGAVVLAKAMVTKDVPPYAIVGGIPAKIMGYRYDENIIPALMKIKWWNWDFEKIRERWKDFHDVESFILKYK